MLPVRIDFNNCYKLWIATKTSGIVRIISDLTEDIVGQDVLLVMIK